MRKFLTLFLCVVLTAGQLMAQNKTVTGKVTDEKGNPVANATVVVKGTTSGTTTSNDGSFSLAVTSTAKVLLISSINFISQDVAIGNKSTLSITLAPTSSDLSEVVVVGYGVQSKKTSLQSIGVIKSEAFQNQPIISATQALQGQVAGVQMTNSSGVLGAASNVRVRGTASILGGGQPLYVVDGVPLNDGTLSAAQGGGAGLNPLIDINPNDIESISVLKDAGAVAIYGSRGTNGVIIIKTKKGKNGQKTRINVDAFSGQSNPTDLIDMMDADQYRQYVTDFRSIRGQAPITQPTGSFDWIDAVVRTGKTNSVSASAIGGTDKTKFYLGANYYKESSYTIGNDLNRLSGRINLDHEVSKNVRVGTNFNISNTRSDRIGVENNTNAVLTSSYLQLPYVQPYDASGNFVNTGFIQNVLGLEALNINDFLSRRTYGNIYTEIKLLKDFTFKTDWGIDLVQTEERGRTNSLFLPGGSGFRTVQQDQKWLTTNTLTYDKKFNKHSINAFVAQSFETSTYDAIQVAGSGFASDALPNVGSASTPTTTFASRSVWALTSYFGRASYSYNSKYNLEVTARSDGSSRFGPNNKYGNFWSVAGGWIISDEAFFQKVKFIDLLKLNASYGTSGNDRIGNFPYQAFYGGGTGADYNSAAGLIPTQVPNPDLQWEESKQWNVGLTLNMFKSRLNISVDVYNKRTVNNLVNVPLPFTTGFASQTRNIGEVENKGVDLSINTVNVQGKDFTWSTNLNIGFLKNTILSLPENRDPEGRNFLAGSAAQRAIVGESLNTFYVIRYSGINSQTGNAEWLNRDGATTNAPIANDRVVAGSAIPKFTGGFTNNFKYRNFDVSAFFNFSSGNKVLIDGLRFTENLNAAAGFNKSTNVANFWRKAGDVSFAPALNSSTALIFNQLSTLQVQDGSYLRLKTVSFGYNVPKSVLGKTNFIQGFRFYVLGQNLWILQNKDFRGPDAEVSANGGSNQIQGESFFALPQSKTVTVGVNITF